jgi:hypothetical protein
VNKRLTLELIVMGVVGDGKGAMQTTMLMMYHHDVCLFVCVGGVGEEKPVANQGNVANSAMPGRTCTNRHIQQSSSQVNECVLKRVSDLWWICSVDGSIVASKRRCQKVQ